MTNSKSRTHVLTPEYNSLILQNMNELNRMNQCEILYLNNHNNSMVVTRAGQLFNNDRIAVIPSDTVYGLSGNYFSRAVRDKISQIKQRPADKGFIVLLPDVDFLVDFADQSISEMILKQIPAPLTLIVKNKYQHLYGEKTLAIRIPNDPWLKELLREIKMPLISTSANISGKKIPNTSEELIKLFNQDVDLIILKETITDSAPSTILDISAKPYQILRQGDFIVDEDILAL